MRAQYTLSPSQLQQTINLQWPAAQLIVDNPTPSAVLVNLTGPSTPTRELASLIVPAASFRAIAVEGGSFCAVLESPSVVQTGTPGLGALGSTATVLVLSKDEPIPAAAAVAFQSLSTSDLLAGPTTVTGAQTVGPFDLNTWGGMIVEVQALANCGQTRLSVQTSADGVIWAGLAEFPLWPNQLLLLNLPRVGRYSRLQFLVTAIGGNPPSALVYARATLTEILAVTASAATTSSTTFNLTAGNSLVTDLYCRNLPGLQLDVYLTAAASTASIQLQTSNDGLTTWEEIIREPDATSTSATDQLINGSHYSRLIANPDGYTRIILAAGAAGTLTGTLTYRAEYAPNVPDNSLKRMSLELVNAPNIGAQTDASGASTLIGQTKAINANTAATATSTGSVAGAIGATSDTSALTTVIGRLQQLIGLSAFGATVTGAMDGTGSISLLGQLRGLLTATGTTADTSASNTLVGRLQQLIGIAAFGATVTGAMDGTGSISLLGQLRSIATNLANALVIGTAADSSGANSLIGKLKSIEPLDASALATASAVLAGTWLNTGQDVTSGGHIVNVLMATNQGTIQNLAMGIGTTGGATPSTVIYDSYALSGTGGPLDAGSHSKGIAVGTNTRIYILATSASTVAWSVWYTA